jgi:predicted small lipoprotein YifL
MRHLAIALMLIAAGALAGCGSTGPFTEGLYRLPYADGVEVRITADDLDHGSPAKNMFDMAGVDTEQVLVAAAPGWIRFIEDGNDVGGNANNNYVWIEHPLDYCRPPAPGSVGSTGPTTCKTCPRGLGKCSEWTLTVHMRKDSVTAAPPLGAGLELNEWVEAGQPIGIEGAVGFVSKAPGQRCTDADFQANPLCGRHAHFNVFVFDADAEGADDAPTDNGDYESYADNLSSRPERVPAFCTAAGLRFVRTGEVYVAAPCPDLP